MKQSDLIKQITDQELRRAVVYSQLLFLAITIVLSWILFDSFLDWTSLFAWNLKEIVYYGVIPGIVIVVIDLILIRFVPETYYDDGGANKRIFSNLQVHHIFFLTLLIAISEEFLFR